MSSVSFLIHTRNRVEPLKKCLETILRQDFKDFTILVYDDASDALNVRDELSKSFDDPRLCYERGERALGVTPARDHIMRLATTDIVIGMDDDAWFPETDALSKIMQHFEAHPNHALLVPHITETHPDGDYDCVPFSRDTLKKNPEIVKEPQYVSYYLGPCYAVRRNVLEEIGYLSLRTPYGEDEVDISYKLVRAGHKLFYRPDIRAVHDPVRLQTKRPMNLTSHIQNRVYLAYQYLPMPYCIVYVATWLVFYSRKALQVETTGFANLYKTFFYALKNMKNFTRNPLKEDAIAYEKEHNGRLWC